jgi:ADP-ribose pyrophosphatase YjhB (NUDIX family)
MILHDTTAIIIRKGGRFLLVRRANKPEKGFWAVPGGHVDEGESVWQAAQREAGEEVGDVEVDKKPFFVFVHDAGITHRHRAHVFFGKVTGEVKAGSDAEDVGWFSLKEMENLELTHYTKKIINHILEAGR